MANDNHFTAVTKKSWACGSSGWCFFLTWISKAVHYLKNSACHQWQPLKQNQAGMRHALFCWYVPTITFSITFSGAMGANDSLAAQASARYVTCQDVECVIAGAQARLRGRSQIDRSKVATDLREAEGTGRFATNQTALPLVSLPPKLGNASSPPNKHRSKRLSGHLALRSHHASTISHRSNICQNSSEQCGCSAATPEGKLVKKSDSTSKSSMDNRPLDNGSSDEEDSISSNSNLHQLQISQSDKAEIAQMKTLKSALSTVRGVASALQQFSRYRYMTRSVSSYSLLSSALLVLRFWLTRKPIGVSIWNCRSASSQLHTNTLCSIALCIWGCVKEVIWVCVREVSSLLISLWMYMSGCRRRLKVAIDRRVLKKRLEDLHSFRLPHQTNRLALVFDPLGDAVSPFAQLGHTCADGRPDFSFSGCWWLYSLMLNLISMLCRIVF